MAFPEYQTAVSDPVRARILGLAHDQFLAEGFSRITMDDLAAELGMSKKTLYLHFPTKAALLDAVLEHRLGSMRATMEEILRAPDLGFAGRLARALEALHRRLSEVRPPFMHDLRRHAPEAFRRIDRFRHQFVGEYFGKLLAEGRREGLVRRDLDDRIVIEALLTLVQTTVTPDTVVRMGLTVAGAFETVLKLVLEGVLTDRGRQVLARASRGPGGIAQERRRR